MLSLKNYSNDIIDHFGHFVHVSHLCKKKKTKKIIHIAQRQHPEQTKISIPSVILQ